MNNYKESPNYSYAKFYIRSIAFFIDMVILVVLNTLIISIFMFITEKIIYNFVKKNLFILTGILPLLSFIILFILYFSVTEASLLKASLGKKLLGIVVVEGDTQYKICLIKSLLRTILKLLSFLCIPIFIIIPCSKSKQGLHDYLANTCVLCKFENR